MNRHFFTGAFLLGALAVVWVAFGFLGANVLALLMTVVIGAVYTFGASELHRFRAATATLAQALSAIPDGLSSLEEWLAGVHASLRNPVRLRIEGERIGLPGPALTPYLVGLLVMLGMLGTFLGMVVTLNGAVFALEGTTDLQAIRSAFAAPIKGLGLAFGTSVAGVASSAMLGLMSALSRRERLLAAQLLDTQIATVLRGFSLTHQRQETFKALQAQSQALPAVVDQLQAMLARMERMGQQLGERLLGKQDHFHRETKDTYTALANSVGQSLRDSLTQGAQAAGESIRPVVETAMAGISRDAALQHERMVAATQQQLSGLSAHFQQSTSAVTDAWGQALADQASHDRQRLDAWRSQLEASVATLTREWQQAGTHTLQQQQHICNTLSQTARDITGDAQANAAKTMAELARLTAASEALLRARMAAEEDWTLQHAERMDQVVGTLRTELGALRAEEALRGSAAVERLGELQTVVAGHLTTLGMALEDPITRLIHTASEAPRAAAEVIGQLRQEISNSVARDNALLEERSRILGTLSTLLDAIHHASVEQRGVIDTLVASSAATLDGANSQFAEKVEAQAAKLSDIAAHVTGSAVEVSTLSESFGFAVRSFHDANEKLIANLQRMEGAMDKSMARSDEQLAYYVAQAREIIDLSIGSQKEVVEQLRQLPGTRAPMDAEAA